jgi:hypothetical protein
VSRDEAVNSSADAIDATPNSPQVFLNTLNLPVFEITRKIKRVFKGYRSWQIYITLGALTNPLILDEPESAGERRTSA